MQKKSSADQESAWRNAGQKVGLQIWRIVNFKVTAWPVEDYGQFYDGDSYIVLNTYKKEGSEKYFYDIHFWIGKYSTADEYGTAAYKTVELDTFLNDVPVQHREVQDHESILFKTYFTSITIMRVGAESGFRHVKAQEYLPRLFHFHGDKHRVEVKEITRNADLLDGSDVYILDLGLNLYQWNGETSNKDERYSDMQYLQDLKSERGGNCKAKVLDEKDVIIFDTKEELFVWVGKETTTRDRLNAMPYAHTHLQKTSHPFLPVSYLTEGQFNSSVSFGSISQSIASSNQHVQAVISLYE